MLVGLKILLIIAIMGGLIAYMGDKLGTKVGKRRMSLFGLRPKHTSIIVTIVTGILVAASTVGVLTLTSHSVRTALFGMEQLRQEMEQLNQEVAAKSKELAANEKALQERNNELTSVRHEVQATQAELEEARYAKEQMGQELVTVQEAYDRSAKQLQDLESTKKTMEEHIASLQVTTKQLEEGITQLREGTIIFRVNELLSQAIVRPGLTEQASEQAISNILKDTNKLILRRLQLDESRNVLYVSRTNLAEAAKQVAASKEPMVVQIIAAGNIIVGEPAIAEIHVYPQTLVYKKGTVVAQATLTGGNNAQYQVLSFLHTVNSTAKAEGIIPDSLTGDVGKLPGDELFQIIRRVEEHDGALRIEAVVSDDTYTSGPLPIHLRLTFLD